MLDSMAAPSPSLIVIRCVQSWLDPAIKNGITLRVPDKYGTFTRPFREAAPNADAVRASGEDVRQVSLALVPRRGITPAVILITYFQ